MCRDFRGARNERVRSIARSIRVQARSSGLVWNEWAVDREIGACGEISLDKDHEVSWLVVGIFAGGSTQAAIAKALLALAGFLLWELPSMANNLPVACSG